MNKAIKALLLSLLVFPGIGHLALKKYRSATLIIVATSVACYQLIANVVNNAMNIVGQIERGVIQATASDITTAINQQTAMDTSTSHFVMLFILAIWVIAAIDAYRIGKKSS